MQIDGTLTRATTLQHRAVQSLHLRTDKKSSPRRQQHNRVTCSAEQSRSFSVIIEKPLGLILLPLNDEKGAYVDEIVSGGNAEALKVISTGDAIQSLQTDTTSLPECGRRTFDEIISYISNQNGSIKVVFERPELLPIQEEEKAEYWQNKNRTPKVLRRTVGVQPTDILISRTGPIGTGNFGTVFRGVWKGKDVVLKCAKTNVYGATELLDAELELNEIVHKRARGSCAKFLGCCEIDPRYEGQIYNGSLNAGLWLMWEFSGTLTLGNLLTVTEEELITRVCNSYGHSTRASFVDILKLIMRSILSNLKALHDVGIVHRDVKPDNILLTETGFVFIDLGAAAQCLGSPINYSAGTGPADPRYCRPNDIYLIPHGAPEPNMENLDELWSKHQPEKFDIFSVGIIMMQLCFPELREEKHLRTFNAEFEKCKFDLQSWRNSDTQLRCVSPVLAQNEDAGWNLVSQLLQGERATRTSARNALEHNFLK